MVVQLFALGHSVLFEHTRCEHGAVVHGAGHLRDAGLSPTSLDGVSSIRPSEGASGEHAHCDELMTRPALLSVSAACCEISLLETQPPTTVASREAERVLAVLSVAPKTSPTAA